MSGKRILDAVALLGVARRVAAKHFEIRLQQASIYARTSSLTKAIRRQGKPAFASSTQPFSQTASATTNPISKIFDFGAQKSDKPDLEANQDIFYDRSENNSSREPVSKETLTIHQKEATRNPLPDGTIPPDDSPSGEEAGDGQSYYVRPTVEEHQDPFDHSSGEELDITASRKSTIPTPNTSPLSSEKAKILQRQSEDQIPANPADPPSDAEMLVDQDQDLFYQPPSRSTPVLSALPRTRIPKNENDVQGGDSHIPNNINSDVYYSGKEEGESQNQEQPLEEQLSEEQISQMFHSPRVAKMMGKGVKKSSGASGRNYHTARILSQKSEEAEKADIRKLAADMAKDAQAGTKDLGSEPKPYQMRESRVPSSRFGRFMEYGGLAASMAYGAVSESISRSGGPDGSLMLSAANMERLVAKLSKMRGAALKLGQMMSFQDSKMLPKPIHDVLQRVQDSADYMPVSQRDAVIASDLGPNWKDLFVQFDEKPIAAASIGQVHGAVLKSNQQRVAVKVQYPGVADSISSDLNNLSLLLTASRLLPKGLYLDKTIANARTELAWECDYMREAAGAKRFKKLLADEQDIFTVPGIIDEASGRQVLTMERMEGAAVTKIQTLSQAQKDWIGEQILRLCLREMVEFKYMQTDPNWTNFLYNNKTNKLELLDFGASRDFPERFITLYVKVLDAASRKDRKACEKYSVELGYLTGYESKAMLNAHIDSVITLAEPFLEAAPDLYDFKDQTITDRVRDLIPVMLRERLAPPPEETYSLHRKLSGAFLLCARLGSRVRCKELFQRAMEKAGVR